MVNGALITVEGGDGAGKTTQITYIAEYLKKANISVLQTREPGGTPLGEKLREILLRKDEYKIGNEAELLMMFAARYQHIEEVIMPALNANHWVLCDRFTDATFAYQGGGRGIDKQRIQALSDSMGMRPDLTLLLDIPVDQGLQRVQQRNAPTDRFEQQNLVFKQSVRQAYLDLATTEPQRIKVINASLSLQQVQQQIDQILRNFIGQFNGRKS